MTRDNLLVFAGALMRALVSRRSGVSSPCHDCLACHPPVMATSQDRDGRDDQSCPQWCVTGGKHLHHHLQHCVDLWHQGSEVIVATQRSDENRRPIEMRVRLDQEEQVDAQGHSRHPVHVACGRYSLSPDQARELASVLLQMAGEAEQVADWT